MDEKVGTVLGMTLLAPLSGIVIPLAAVPDDVFSEGMLGDGLAIEPTDGLVLAPVSGLVESLPQSGHAIAIRSAEGVAVLVHVGIDTVHLGQYFQILVAQGDHVDAGQAVIRFDLATVRREAPAVTTPVIIVEAPPGLGLNTATPDTEVTAGLSPVAWLRPIDVAKS